MLLILAAAMTADAAAHRYLFLQPNASAPAPIQIKHVGEPVKDEYLAFLEDGDRHEVPGIANGLAHAHQGRLIRVWNDGVQGFWISMNAMQAEGMLHNPHIRSIEENAVVHESGTQAVGGGDPFWHLDRIDQRSGTDGTFQYCNGATQVYAYSFDHGVRAADPQLTGRVIAGKNAAPADGVCASNTDNTQPAPYPDGGSFDERNPCGEHNVLNAAHGTAVATLVAGLGVGVAKTAIVVPLRLANCQNLDTPAANQLTEGSWIDAFDWVMGSTNALWDPDNQRSRVPAVANFSVFFYILPKNPSWNVEFEVERRLLQLIRGGIVVVASANNQNTAGLAGDPNSDPPVAPNGSLSLVPSRLSYSTPYTFFDGTERVISVGGTMLTGGVDQRWVCGTASACGDAKGSNYGSGVDIWAPAHNIQAGHNASLTPGTDDPWSGAQYRRPFTFGPADRRPLTACTPAQGELTPFYARSGTSFAAPLVTGAAARLLSEDPSLFDANDPSTTSAKVWSRLSASATHLDPSTANLGAGSPNLFLYISGVNFKTQPQSSSFSAGGTISLISEAAGTGLSYRLYEGHSGDTATPVSNSQASGTFAVAPSTTKTYWIRATNSCPTDGSSITGDSADATLVLTPVVTATATNSTTVSVDWTNVGGAGTTYDVFRAGAGAAFNFTQPLNSSPLSGSSFADLDRVANNAYAYKVRATNGTTTAISLPDYAATTIFTDADLTVSPTVKAAHIRELRSAVNKIAEAMGVSGPYTSPELSAPSTGQAVTSAGFTDVMSRLNNVRTTIYGLQALAFASTPVAGGPIMKSHLISLRAAVN